MPGRLQRIEMAQHLLRIVDLRAVEPARAGHALVAEHARMREIPDGPEREELFLQAKRIAATYMPYRYTAHRVEADLLHGWVSGYRRPLFWLEWWHMVDIDTGKQAALLH